MARGFAYLLVVCLLVPAPVFARQGVGSAVLLTADAGSRPTARLASPALNALPDSEGRAAPGVDRSRDADGIRESAGEAADSVAPVLAPDARAAGGDANGSSFSLATVTPALLGSVPVEERAPQRVGILPAPLTRRPAALLPLQISFVALQALDVHSTTRALGRGPEYVEANPVMSGVASNRAALVAVKAGTAAGVVFLSEKLWKKNRAAAIILMATLNSVTATIVAHNYRVTR